MPKIIDNLENKLIAEAKKQIEEAGYNALTIRSVARGCGVGIGTVYNYFPSKDALVASWLLQDWKECIARIRAAGTDSDDTAPLVRCIYDQLQQFALRHRTLFQDAAAAGGFAGSFSPYHGLLRQQLAEPLEKFCSEEFAAEFIAEALLTWTIAGKSFDEIYGMICRLF